MRDATSAPPRPYHTTPDAEPTCSLPPLVRRLLGDAVGPSKVLAVKLPPQDKPVKR